MNYGTAKLVLPINYELISENEAKKISGGEPITATAVVGIIAGVIASVGGVIGIGVSLHHVGELAAERVFYGGSFSNSDYQKNKWKIRAGVIAANPVVGPLVMTGFEKKFYELVSQRGW